MSHESCITCGARFTPRPMHPAITPSWCPECTTIMRECVMEQFANVGPCPAMRSSDV